MEEIKVGEYVRSYHGEIYKVGKINEDYLIEDKEYGAMGCFIDDVKKHSKNIIDLIEERRLCEWKRSLFDRNINRRFSYNKF